MPDPSIPTGERILIDASAIPENLGGVGRYVTALVEALAHLGTPPLVVCQPRDARRFRDLGARRVFVVPAAAHRTLGRFVWEQLGLPRLLRRERIRVLHSPHYTFPLFTTVRRVVTVHDLTFFTLPELHGAVKRRFFRAWIRAAALVRATVVTPSVATKEDYLAFTTAQERSVIVALHGYDSSRFHAPTRDQVTDLAAKLRTTDAGWIGFLGTLEPRKNVPALVAAYRRSVAGLEPDQRPALLLAGGPGWDQDVAPSVRRAVRAGFDVRLLGYLPLAELPPFLAGARILAYPSLGEGFGLPVLEAMACGACVLTTARPAIPEVGAGAVAYSEPDDASLAAAITELLEDSSANESLRTAALARAAQFGWDRSAREHRRAYTLAAGGRA